MCFLIVAMPWNVASCLLLYMGTIALFVDSKKVVILLILVLISLYRIIGIFNMVLVSVFLLLRATLFSKVMSLVVICMSFFLISGLFYWCLLVSIPIMTPPFRSNSMRCISNLLDFVKAFLLPINMILVIMMMIWEFYETMMQKFISFFTVLWRCCTWFVLTVMSCGDDCITIMSLLFLCYLLSVGVFGWGQSDAFFVVLAWCGLRYGV